MCKTDLFSDPNFSGRLLKIWNWAGDIEVLALLNISGKGDDITEVISHQWVESVFGDDWLCYFYSRLPVQEILINAQASVWKSQGFLYLVDCFEWHDDIRVEVRVAS